MSEETSQYESGDATVQSEAPGHVDPTTHVPDPEPPKLAFRIDSGIEIPPRNVGRPGNGNKFSSILAEMQIGDSVGGLTEKEATYFTKCAKAKGFEVTSRKIDGMKRVWRVK